MHRVEIFLPYAFFLMLKILKKIVPDIRYNLTTDTISPAVVL